MSGRVSGLRAWAGWAGPAHWDGGELRRWGSKEGREVVGVEDTHVMIGISGQRWGFFSRLRGHDDYETGHLVAEAKRIERA